MKNKTVVQLNQVITIPENHIECSLCGIYKNPESYRNEGEEKQSRTNCRECYETPSAQWAGIKEKRQSYQSEKNALEEKIQREQALMGNSIPVEDLIKALKKLPKGSRVAVTQDGYYACGKFADVFSEPKLIELSVYSIGHSSQNY